MGRSVPVATLHVAHVIIAAVLCVLVLEGPLWRAVGLALLLAGAFAPGRISPWWLLLALAASQLRRTPSATDPTFYLLLAGVHLLHVLASLTRLLPWRGRLEVRALVGPLWRFAMVQMVSQAVAVGALLAFRGERGAWPGLPIVAAGLLAVVALALGRGVRTAGADAA